MNPYDHARSSARMHGGSWQDYHAFHAWFDATKAVRCHFTHRALRHHHEGVAVAGSLFGGRIVNADGGVVDTDVLGRQHLDEDCRHAPAATDWLIGFTRPMWQPNTTPAAEDLADLSARRFGGAAADHLPLHRWFLETAAWAAGTDHLLFRHHAFGAFEAEEKFGPVIAWNGGAIPTRVAAERHIQTVVGRVPSANDWLRGLKGERWMLQATSAVKLGLDDPLPRAA